jgi:hypothetical protein
VRPADNHPLIPIVLSIPPLRSGRSVRVRNYALPKPYRKKAFVEDTPRMSRRRLAVLTLSCLTIASLVAALAMLAKENLESPPVLVIAAPVTPEAASPAAAPLAPYRAPVDGPASPVLTALAIHAAPRAVAAPVPKAARAPRAAPKPELPPSDPDVDLVTVILTLTMPPANAVPATAAVCTPGTPSDHGCPAIHGMEP